jgi:hypothetical protein
METSPTDGALGGDTLTPYDFAMEELGIVSSNLACALLSRTVTNGALPVAECAEARRVYDKLANLRSRLRLAAAQRDSLGHELELLRARLEECEDYAEKR